VINFTRLPPFSACNIENMRETGDEATRSVLCLYACIPLMVPYTVFSTSIIQSMMGGHGLGGAYGHFKAFELPCQRNFCTEGLLGRHALCMLGRTLLMVPILSESWIYMYVHPWVE
jgi:hypothetical protein